MSMQSQIFEPIDVISLFHGMELDIIRFKWRESIYNVSKLNATWKIPTGPAFTYHYSVFCARQNVVCEISYDVNCFKWELVQMVNID